MALICHKAEKAKKPKKSQSEKSHKAKKATKRKKPRSQKSHEAKKATKPKMPQSRKSHKAKNAASFFLLNFWWDINEVYGSYITVF